MKVKLIKFLIKKIKGKKALGLKSKVLKKIFFEFCIFDFFGKKIFLNYTRINKLSVTT